MSIVDTRHQRTNHIYINCHNFYDFSNFIFALLYPARNGDDNIMNLYILLIMDNDNFSSL